MVNLLQNERKKAMTKHERCGCMLRKGLILLIVLFVSAVFVNADDREDLEKLKKEKAELDLKLYEKRIEVIQKDPELKALHEKIMAYHKEFSVRLDKHPDMADLLRKDKRLSAEIEAIEERLQNKKEYDKEGKLDENKP